MILVVDGELISSIKEGLCVLIGIGQQDAKKDIEYLLVYCGIQADHGAHVRFSKIHYKGLQNKLWAQ